MNEHCRSCSGFRRYTVVLAAIALLGLLISCGGKRSGAPSTVSPETANGPEAPAGLADGPDLVMLKDASGAPTGVKVYWWRIDENDAVGYYLYRDTEPITEPDPTLRVNGGAVIPQPDEGVPAVLFDDLFGAQVGVTYYYRVSAVDFNLDESVLSIQRSITISAFFIESFTPVRGPVGARVTINGDYFGEYNDQTDAVYFTGVRNDKGPSALYVDDIQANILSWENIRIQAYVPIGTTVGTITIVSDSVPQEIDGDFECTSPYILSISPDPATAGGEINFYGANFGPPDGMNKVLVDDVAYGGVFTYWSDDHVVGDLPGSMEAKLSKLELLIGTDITNPYYCVIIAGNLPVIDKITPGFGVAGSFALVEIQGSNFGSDENNVTVWFNGVAVAGSDLEMVSDTAIELEIPDGASRTGEVHVIVDDYGPLESNHYLYHTLPGTVTSFDDGIIAGRILGEYSDIAIGPNGSGYIVFTQSNETGGASALYLAYDDGSGLVIDELVSTNKECRFPRIAVDTSGVVHFAYQTYGFDGEVRYGTWDGGVTNDELVYMVGSMFTPGAYLDMLIFDDGAGGIDRLLVWSNELDGVMCGHKLDGESFWTTDVVYTADVGYSEQAGYYCSIDLTEFAPPPPAPPPARIPSQVSGSYTAGISFGLYTENGGPHHEVLFAYSDDLDNWNYEVVGASSEPVTETVMRWHHTAVEPFVLWSTDSAINWSYFDNGWSSMEITSAGDHYGAALDLYIDESTNDQYMVSNEGQDGIFLAYFDSSIGEWDSYSEPFPDGRRIEHVGRGGAVLDYANDVAAMSVYDPDMRDAVLIALAQDLMWLDIADGFATPGYDLSNRAVVCDSNGAPHVVFGDIDPVTGERTLWMARLYDGAPPSPFGGWEFDLIDSASSGTLGHATMAIDAFEDFHIAYLKGDDVMYVAGSFDNFGTPKVVFTPGNISTAPGIALGVNSPLDVNILVPEPGSWWTLWLFQSNDGMATHMEYLVLTSGNPFAPGSAITQYDLAVRCDGEVAVAAYLDSPDNALFVCEPATGELAQSFSGTSGMNAGVTLTLDEDMHYCVTLADLEGTGAGYMLHWDYQLGDYALTQFTSDAEGSMTMSQWRTELGPFIGFLWENTQVGQGWATDCFAYVEGIGSDLGVCSFYDEQVVPIRHSADPFSYEKGVFAYFADAKAYHNLWLFVGPSP